jgi:hypothetical protein
MSEIGGSQCRLGVTSRLQSPLRLSTSPRCLILPGVTRAGCLAPDFRRGQHRQTCPHGAVTSGNAAAMAVRRGGSVRRKLLSARICGKFRITRRRRPWLATTMLGAAFMDRPARRYIGSVEKTITTPAYRFPFARLNSWTAYWADPVGRVSKDLRRGTMLSSYFASDFVDSRAAGRSEAQRWSVADRLQQVRRK